MQIVSCPSCGAEVKFRSHASVMAVCEYCSTRVLKDADAVKDLGKMSSVLEDYSPIQIGTAGVLGGRPFTVVGRIQLRYSAGMWNEWYLLFDDGKTSWLGDSSGMYTITAEYKGDGELPAFEQLLPGRNYPINGAPYTAAEIRVADCIGGQGELPFAVGDGYQAKVADLRRGAEFITLDYSDGPHPVVYTGLSVTLDGMQCQLLRDDDTIQRAAGRYRGKLDALDCPSCGSGIKYLPGVTANLVCPACHTQIDAASPEAQVLAAGERVAAVPASIELGATAKINNQDFTIIGMMRRADDEGTQWNEYLMYGPRAGFSWLVETDEGWSGANVLSEWPAWYAPGSDKVTVDKVQFERFGGDLRGRRLQLAHSRRRPHAGGGIPGRPVAFVVRDHAAGDDMVALLADFRRPVEGMVRRRVQGPRKIAIQQQAVRQQPLSQHRQVHHLVHARAERGPAADELLRHLVPQRRRRAGDLPAGGLPG
jgi:uncharacterized protein (DUF983 family)